MARPDHWGVVRLLGESSGGARLWLAMRHPRLLTKKGKGMTMEHLSTFDLMIGNACITQFDVMADIQTDEYGDWYVAAVYADAIEIDGKRCTNSRDWVQIPEGHWLHNPVFHHLQDACGTDIDARWNRHKWRYAPISKQAGRSL